MESPNRHKSALKFNPQSPVSSTNRGVMRSNTFVYQPSISSNYYSGPGVVDKSWTKENTKPSEFRLHTQQRAAQRARFNSSVAVKLYIIDETKKRIEKVLKVIEEEEVRRLRREMVPRAQLMPIFDKPFSPQRSTRPLTIPKEPRIHMAACKDCKCIFCG